MEPKKDQWLQVIRKWRQDFVDQGIRIVMNVPPEACYLYVSAMEASAGKPVVAIFPQLSLAEDVYRDLRLLHARMDEGRNVLFLPELETGKGYLPESENRVSRIMSELPECKSPTLLTTVCALVSDLPSPERFHQSYIPVSVPFSLSFRQLLERLVEMEYDDEPEVNSAGEFSRRGGIVDVFSPAHDFPVRMEFWGDTLESIRLFDPETQRTLPDRSVTEYRIVPRCGGRDFSESGDGFRSYLQKAGFVPLFFYPEQADEHLARFSDGIHGETWKTFVRLSAPTCITFHDPGTSENPEPDSTCSVLANACFPAVAHIAGELPNELDSGYRQIYQDLIAEQVRQWIECGYCLFFLGTGPQAFAVADHWLNEHGLDRNSFIPDTAEISCGLIFPKERAVFLSEKELFYYGHQKVQAVGPGNFIEDRPGVDDVDSAAALEDAVTEWSHLTDGDYAVHILHGICRYHGIHEVESGGSSGEMICLEFAEGVTLYLPVCQAHLVSRYVGAQRGLPNLSRVGGKTWQKIKLDALRSIRTLAVDMLRTQAARLAKPGYCYPEDDIQQQAFEQNFPFHATADQIRSSREIKQDMMSPTPMDRLLCGDVGYGKTEVAMRAVFKAVNAGRQAAVLVPTTILAQQHFYTFSERFAEYPFMIEMLSRFRSLSEQRQILERLASGGVDIIIGTHRLIQGDIRFKDLGLLIIDEEQRFGVEHKERLKRLREGVDVLTMTATPIPRTLYLSMTGVRSMSTIVTSPGQRLPVKTVVCKDDPKIVADAIDRELQRGGQVFYLHNRVNSIEATCHNLQSLVPKARLAVTHGRMDEQELEQVMADFIAGKIDVLVTTTIIESGLDIPNANTIVIERADRFGLAELYQLRGRVGRWNRQAYAYLLLPTHQMLTGNARERISAIRRFTQLGAGFKLAMRDLEIRGAGNLLGREQSGHINAIGFDLYCRLLKDTVKELQGKATRLLYDVDLNLDFVDWVVNPRPGRLAASIPPAYVPCEKNRLDLYRRLSVGLTLAEIASVRDEFNDRFGPWPEPVENFLELCKLKTMAALAGFQNVKTEDTEIHLIGNSGVYRRKGRIPHLESTAPAEKLHELLDLLSSLIPLPSDSVTED